jgi:diacylglycerol kinase (ATP)
VTVRRAAVIGDAERLARDAEPEFDIVVAAGGDGTMNAVANGLAENPRPLGVLPLGTANVLAREIGLPRDMDALASLMAEGAASPVWPGRVGNRLFLMMAGVGFDAEVAAAVDPKLKRRIGRLAFVWAVLLRLIRNRRCDLRVAADGAEHWAAALIVAKGRHYAGPFVLAPEANLAEPKLDLVLFRDGGRIAALRYLRALLLARISRATGVITLRVRSASVSASEPVPVQADGEIIGAVPVEIDLAPLPVMLIRP